MLRIRLKPTGRKKRISYRVVVQEARSKQTGRATDDLGYYNPHAQPPEIVIDRKQLTAWREKGAQISEGVQKLLSEMEK